MNIQLIEEQINKYSTWVEGRKAQRDLLLKQTQDLEKTIAFNGKEIEEWIKTRWVLSEVVKLTQSKMKDYIESMVTLAIQSIYGSQCHFLADFSIKRNKSEVLFRVQEEDFEPYIPKDDKGIGMVDVIGFVLRPILWSLQKPLSRNTLILDEPMKNMGKLMIVGAQMIKQISQKMGLQIIIITHEPELAEIADKTFVVEKIGRVSEVRVIGKEEPQKLKRRKR